MNAGGANMLEQRVPMAVPESHFVNGMGLPPPFPVGLETAIFGMGCFWGAEQRSWVLEGVYTTAVGYAGGDLAHPTYQEVCGGDTGHAEVVLVVYDPVVISYETVAQVFLGRAQSHARVSSGKRYRIAVQLGHLRDLRRTGQGSGSVARAL